MVVGALLALATGAILLAATIKLPHMKLEKRPLADVHAWAVAHEDTPRNEEWWRQLQGQLAEQAAQLTTTVRSSV